MLKCYWLLFSSVHFARGNLNSGIDFAHNKTFWIRSKSTKPFVPPQANNYGIPESVYVLFPNDLPYLFT